MKQAVSVFRNFVDKVEDKPLEEILNDIKIGTYKVEINDIRTQVNNGNKNAVNQLKKQLKSFTVSGTFTNGRSINKIETYSQYVILDIDKLSNIQLKEITNLTRLAPYTYAYFISPSGKGLKIIVKINSTKEHHKEAYKQVVAYYVQALKIVIDTSGSDICRLCFVSFDEDCFINNNADTFQVIIKPLEAVKSRRINNVANNIIEEYILEIEKTTTDITGDYETWRNIGFAISEEYGETGREYYHRISRFHPKYNHKECDNQYSKCLKAKGSGVSISTFYYNAHQHNIKLTNETNKIETSVSEEKETIKEVKPVSPTFSTSLIPQLPQLLQDMLKHSKTDQEKDLMILGSITTISACLPKLYGIYDGDKIYPNLYLFVSAPAASGKGKIKFCKRLVNLIHDKMQEEAQLMK
jgi:hypothetical protein